MKSKLPKFVRLEVERRARGYCEYCKSQAGFSPDPFSVEHIFPRSLGGSDELSNLALACLGCNNFKFVSISANDPETGEMARLFHPRNDHWEEHFEWAGNFTKIVGRTATGRATAALLKLNRQSLINLRAVLVAAGKHPLP